jgi:hypothetical protein
MVNKRGRGRLGALVAKGPAVCISGLLLVLALIHPHGAAAGDTNGMAAGASSQASDTATETGKKRTVRCHISSDDITIFEGSCEFQQFDKKGSFNISREDENVPLNEDVLFFTVTVTGKNRAQVKAVTTGGHPSQWGAAKLSRKSKACWVGAHFRICTD